MNKQQCLNLTIKYDKTSIIDEYAIKTMFNLRQNKINHSV